MNRLGDLPPLDRILLRLTIGVIVVLSVAWFALVLTIQ